MKQPVVILVDKIEANNSRNDQIDTLIQVKNINKCLKDFGLDTNTIEFSHNVERTRKIIQRHKPLLVFNLVEEHPSSYMAPLILEEHSIPFTGCSSEAIFLTSQKILSKKWLQMNHILTPHWISSKNEAEAIALGNNKAEFILKPINGSASYGIEENCVITVSEEKIWDLICLKTKETDMKFFAEKYINGREFNVSLLGSGKDVSVLPIQEILFQKYYQNRKKIVCYKAKWDTESPEYIQTTRTFCFTNKDEALLKKLKSVSLRIWELFGLNGYARLDFRIDTEGIPYVIDINANPCITPDSGFVAAAEKAGISYAEIIKYLIESTKK